MTSDQILAALAKLGADRPFTLVAVEGALDVELARADTSNTYFTVYQGSESGLTGVELRAPTDPSSGKGGLLIVDIADPCIQRAAVVEQFGPATPGPPPPPGRGGTARPFEKHTTPWGEVRTRYSDAGCLDQITLDALAPR